MKENHLNSTIFKIVLGVFLLYSNLLLSKSDEVLKTDTIPENISQKLIYKYILENDRDIQHFFMDYFFTSLANSRIYTHEINRNISNLGLPIGSFGINIEMPFLFKFRENFSYIDTAFYNNIKVSDKIGIFSDKEIDVSTVLLHENYNAYFEIKLRNLSLQLIKNNIISSLPKLRFYYFIDTDTEIGISLPKQVLSPLIKKSTNQDNIDIGGISVYVKKNKLFNNILSNIKAVSSIYLGFENEKLETGKIELLKFNNELLNNSIDTISMGVKTMSYSFSKLQLGLTFGKYIGGYKTGKDLNRLFLNFGLGYQYTQSSLYYKMSYNINGQDLDQVIDYSISRINDSHSFSADIAITCDFFFTTTSLYASLPFLNDKFNFMSFGISTNLMYINKKPIRRIRKRKRSRSSSLKTKSKNKKPIRRIRKRKRSRSSLKTKSKNKKPIRRIRKRKRSRSSLKTKSKNRGERKVS